MFISKLPEMLGPVLDGALCLAQKLFSGAAPAISCGPPAPVCFCCRRGLKLDLFVHNR